MVVSPAGTVGATTGVYFGDADTGIYENIDDELYVTIDGNPRWIFSLNSFGFLGNDGGRIYSGAASNTIPTLIPRAQDFDTGIGSGAIGEISIIADGVEVFDIDGANALIKPGGVDVVNIDANGLNIVGLDKPFLSNAVPGADIAGYSFVGDTGTGLGKNAPNEFTFVNNGVQSATISENRIRIAPLTSGVGTGLYFGDNENYFYESVNNVITIGIDNIQLCLVNVSMVNINWSIKNA